MKARMYLLTLIVSTVSVLSYAGTLNDYNPWDVNITDDNDGAADTSDLLMSGAPAGSVITKVKVYFEIRHTWPEDLEIWLTTYYDGSWHDYPIYEQGDLGSTPDVVRTIDNITEWNGASPNQTWYLCVRDRIAQDTGYIDFFELWVTYDSNDAPNTPSSEDPDDGETGVSRTANLDWSCSDPDGDTLYYTVYFEKNDSTPDTIIKNDSTGSSADPGTMDYDSHYYWRVKADDHNGGVTWSPVWDFYTEPEPVIDANVTGVSFDRTEVERGVQNITATVSLQNTGNQSWTFYVGGSSIKSGDTTWYDWSPARASKTLSAGSSGTVQVTWDVPSDAPLGLQGFYSKVYKYNTGDDFVDEDWRDSSFEVIAQTLPAISSGRMAWHSYSEYDDDNGDGYRSIDGRILVYDFSSNSHNSRAENTIAAGVQHAMNPNFSSDGRYITFMGLPKTRTYSHYSSWAEYLDLFIYDFRDDRLINLSSNVGRGSFNQFEEDPVFSPDGQYVAFKYQRSDIWVARLSDYNLRRVTAGAGEESGPQYSPDGNWITFWVGDGANAYIAKVSAGSTSATTYTTIVDNDVAGDAGIQDYFPSYWDESRLIYTSWDTAQLPGVNDDDDIRIRNLSSGSDYLAAFNSAYPVDDSDAFPITSDLLGFSKRQGSYWDLWYGDPVAGGAETLGIGDANKHNLGGEYTTSIVSYVPNNAPTDLALSSNTVPENEPSETTVGTLSTTDPDTGNSFTYSLVGGTGSSDNASFSIIDDKLQTDATFNFESDSSYTIRVRTSDQGGLWYEEIFSISVINVNETPVGMSLSSSTVIENQPAGTLVGSISTSDPDAGDSFSYSLVGGTGSADNESFSVVGNEVQTDTSFNYEVQNSCSIRVRTTDHDGLWYEKTFTIGVSDVSEPAPILEAPSLNVDGKSVLRWSSIANHMYTIYFTTNLTEGFSMLRENIPATPPTNTHTNFTEGAQQGFWYISTDE